MTLTFASLFTGGGGADLGAIAAGLDPIWGIEKDPDISYWGDKNIAKHKKSCLRLYSTNHQDINTIDFSWLKRPDWLHASPPCINASRVNNGNETSEDKELSDAIIRAIAILNPKYFSLENVAGYRQFYSFGNIKNFLEYEGYGGHFKVLDCSDYGVPQSRKRLFLVAVKDTPSKNYLSLKKQEPVGCIEAITDLIHALPECNLTKSQLLRFKRNGYSNYMGVNLAIQNSGSRKDKKGNPTNIIRLADEPIWTLRAMSGEVRVNPHQVTLIVDGKVLRPSIECYSRWQTFPDSYQWPADFKLAMKICGNAVPPLMMKQIIEAVIHA